MNRSGGALGGNPHRERSSTPRERSNRCRRSGNPHRERSSIPRERSNRCRGSGNPHRGSSSGFLPRFLGIWLIINGITYVALSLTALLLPQSYRLFFSYSFPMLLGELAIMLWLLILGPKEQALGAAALSSDVAAPA